MKLRDLTDGLVEAGLAFVTVLFRYDTKKRAFNTRIYFPCDKTEAVDEIIEMTIRELYDDDDGPRSTDMWNWYDRIAIVEPLKSVLFDLRELSKEGWNYALVILDKRMTPIDLRSYFDFGHLEGVSVRSATLDVIGKIMAGRSKLVRQA